MDKKERYLRNPHITLNEKMRRQLGITPQDVAFNGHPAGLVPIIEDQTPELRTQEIRSLRKNDGTAKP